MKLRFLNKTIENKRFNYTPMYYDEQKEYLELKKAQYRDLPEDEKGDELRKSILRNELQTGWSRVQHATAERKASNVRILLLIGIIVGLGYFILFGLDEVDVVVEKLW